MLPRDTQNFRDLLTVSDAAELLGVSVDTLRNWCDAGKVRHYRTPGNQRRFRREDLLALLEPIKGDAA
jgi:excisionase family DNA binding protein